MPKQKISELSAETVATAVSPLDGLRAVYLGHSVEDNESGDATHVANFVLVERPDGAKVLAELHTVWAYHTYVFAADPDREIGGDRRRDEYGSTWEFNTWSSEDVGGMPHPAEAFVAARLYWGGHEGKFPGHFRLEEMIPEAEKGAEWVWAP